MQEKGYAQVLSLSKYYLAEIKRRFFYCLAFFTVVFFAFFLFSEKIIKFFLGIFKFEDVQIITSSPFQFFGLSVNMAIAIAIILTFPIIMYNIFSFLSPALTKKEKRGFVKVFFLSLIFFISGFLFGFYVLNYVLMILAQYNAKAGLVNMWDIRVFVSQIFLTASFLGIIFQFPIVISILIRKNIVSVEVFKKKRKWVILLAFAIAALLPPTDGLSLLVMALFLIVIFEMTLLYNRKASVKKKKV